MEEKRKKIISNMIDDLDKRDLVKTSIKIGGIVLAGKVVKDISNGLYNGTKKNTKKVFENKKKIKNNKKKIKNTKEYIKTLKKEKSKKKKEKADKQRRILKAEKEITCFKEKNKYARKNIAKHSSLAIGEAVILPVALGVTGVVGSKLFEIEKQTCRDINDDFVSQYREIEYNLEEEDSYV